jgi:hypothetical protein
MLVPECDYLHGTKISTDLTLHKVLCPLKTFRIFSGGSCPVEIRSANTARYRAHEPAANPIIPQRAFRSAPRCAAIKSAAALISSHHENQTFLESTGNYLVNAGEGRRLAQRSASSARRSRRTSRSAAFSTSSTARSRSARPITRSAARAVPQKTPDTQTATDAAMPMIATV